MSRAQQIEDRAALWVLRREEPSWSCADQAELDHWLQESDAHRAAYWRLEFGWRQADRIASLGAPLQSRSKRLDGLSWGRPLALVASLLLVFALLLQWPWSFTGTPQLASGHFETPVGGHEIVSLPDGSRVELNTDTAIRALINAQSRTVWLERGEAFFEVAKQHGRKFVIYAGSRTVTVLGTKFSVRRDPSQIVVAVLEGRVRVDPTAADVSDRHTMVTAGDVAIARGRNTIITNSVEAVQQQLAWRSGRLVFHDETLADAVRQFNRYNRKQLVIGDPGIAQLLVGGSFLVNNVEAFTQLLRDAYGLDVEQAADKITLSGRRLADRGSLTQLRPTLIEPRPKHSSAAGQCGSSGNCAAVPLAPAVEQSTSGKSPEEVLRQANNWDVLYKLYPPRARAAHEEGLVGFTVKIDAGGNPVSCKITRSSGHPLLDLETCELIMVHAVFKRSEGLSRSQQRTYEGVVNWRLPPMAQAMVGPTPKPVAGAAAPEELVCKRILKTGSNVVFERKCMTNSEWQHATDDDRDAWDKLRSEGVSR